MYPYVVSYKITNNTLDLNAVPTNFQLSYFTQQTWTLALAKINKIQNQQHTGLRTPY
jgi:hypothetical protein